MDAPAQSRFPRSLTTTTPEEGFELAITLSRRAAKAAQPDTDVLKKLRHEYANHAYSLIAVSQVVATHFQTIAMANNCWRGSQTKDTGQ